MRKILMCYEERPVAPRVIERTAQLAKAFDATVVVTSVARVLHGMAARGMGGIDPTDPPERHAEEVEDAAARLAELGVAKVEKVTGIGDPTRAILQLAEERQVDVIVVGAHDGGMLSQLVESSPAGTIATKAHADVLVVH
jgi:nucleotide-binding universal stress UspA family protein